MPRVPKVTRGFVIAAPASGSGKTTITLALLRHLRDAGVRVASLKVGPDFIDPAFHAAASGRPCFNLDPWAMRTSTFAAAIAAASREAELVIAEGVMGLFDGATAHEGSTADVAAATGWPVLLVVDAGAMAASAAAVVHGFAGFRSDIDIAGVVFNRVGSDRHAELLREASANTGVPVLGALRRDPALSLPDRHLGLVQASEHPDLEGFLNHTADRVSAALDIDALMVLPRRTRLHASSPAPSGACAPPLPVLGQRIAVARDRAFDFAYPLVLEAWRRAGAEVSMFSPLADEAPSVAADAVYLPGGYPELHAGSIAGARQFMSGLRAAAARGAAVYAECGGYMVLGESLTDVQGKAHAMAGLLSLETTFAERGLTLGYRSAVMLADGPLGAAGASFRGHEFHYAKVLREDGDSALFRCADTKGRDLGTTGRRAGNIMGSFVHLVDRSFRNAP